MTKIDKVLKRVVEEQLSPARIVRLSVEHAEEFDGDPILRISVVFKADDDRFDPEKVLGLKRHLRKSLEEVETDSFPILSYMTEAEAADAAA